MIDRTGKRYGKLIVISRAANKGAKVQWNVRCDCGNTKTVGATSLQMGLTKSCGCLHQVGYNAKHRMVGTKEYNTWNGMKQRCFNPNSQFYANYGGRGITVADEWISSFQAFYEHIGPAPSGAHSIDRIDNDGNYEPGNVRWATSFEQVHNRRPRRLLEKCHLGHSNWYPTVGRARRCRTCNALARRRYVARKSSMQ